MPILLFSCTTRQAAAVYYVRPRPALPHSPQQFQALVHLRNSLVTTNTTLCSRRRHPPAPLSSPRTAMGSSMEQLMQRRLQERQDAYDAQWNNGLGSHHPDYDPTASGPGAVKASRATEELYNAIVKNDLASVYEKIAEGADVNFVFGEAYQCAPGYTPLMVACHRGRLECAKALLRAGADPNYVNEAGDLTLFWAIDGGPALIKLLVRYGAELDAVSPKGWTALSYAVAKGKYGPTEEAGIYAEDVLLYYGASKYGEGPPALGSRSPRQSFDPEAANFSRERGSYQAVFEAP